MEKAYLRILIEELRVRVERRPAYSMRRYADDIGISPSSLSQILNEKSKPGPALAERVANGLGLSDEVRAEFFRSLFGDGAGSGAARWLASRKEPSPAAPPEEVGELLSDDAALVLSAAKVAGGKLDSASLRGFLPSLDPIRIQWAIEALRGHRLLVASGEGAWRVPAGVWIRAGTK